MQKQKISVIIESWEKTGTITKEMADTIAKRFEDIVKYELGYVDELIDKKTPNKAFGRLSRFLSFLNMATSILPSIQKDYGNWIFNIRKRIDKIAKELGAQNYHLTLETPAGISLTLVFNV
jgi:hypothetical protein